MSALHAFFAAGAASAFGDEPRDVADDFRQIDLPVLMFLAVAKIGAAASRTADRRLVLTELPAQGAISPIDSGAFPLCRSKLRSQSLMPAGDAPPPRQPAGRRALVAISAPLRPNPMASASNVGRKSADLSRDSLARGRDTFSRRL